MSQLFIHPLIQCEADKLCAIEYVQPNGDRVLAYCRASADEFYRNRPQQEELPLREKERTLFES